MLTGMERPEPDRPAESWKYPYVAGVVDMASNLTINVRKDSDTRVGYMIGQELQISNSDPTVLGFIDEFCEEHGLNPNLRETENSYLLQFSRRDDFTKFLRLVQPYLLNRHKQVEILLEHLIPGLNEGKASTEGGFYELMEHVEAIRAEDNKSSRKYDREYFAEEWDLD